VDVIKTIIKNNYIFNNIIIASRLGVIKISPKLDIAIIWLDLCRSKAKGLINRCFNIENYIATIREANMNPGVLQCKNCWKWRYATFACRI